MTCPGTTLLNGLVPGGGGAGLPAGVDAFTFANVGFPTGVITTTNGVAQVISWGSLPVVGASIGFQAILFGQRDDGTMGTWAWRIGNFARNAIGANLLAPVTFGATGYTDAALQPWSTIGVPAGWICSCDFQVGNSINIVIQGAAGQTVQWSTLILRHGFNGAVLP